MKATLVDCGETIKTKDQPLFGLWKDCGDLADPASYLRNLRRPRPVPGFKKQAGARKAK